MDDLDKIRSILPSMTVNELKLAIRKLNDSLNSGIKITGNKPELIDRLRAFIAEKKSQADEVALRALQETIYDLTERHNPRVNPPQRISVMSAISARKSSYPRIRLAANPNSSSTSTTSASTSSSISPLHNSNTHQTHINKSTLSTFGSPISSLDRAKYKPSPFYDIDGKLTASKLCSEARESRNQINLEFKFNELQLQKLGSTPKPIQYQARFFCGCWPGDVQQGGMLIEYPQICEIKVNGITLQANLRGLKNKPGTVNPLDITTACTLNTSFTNRVEFIYANTNKKYIVIAQLVKTKSVDSIADMIKDKKFVTKEDVLKRIQQRNEDSDVVLGSSTVSLKCPLGHMPIKLPGRSVYCQHIQCFDIYNFLYMNEQTPTWTCPVCSRNLKSWDELVVDGYIFDVLQRVPKDQESILVEADGSWSIKDEDGPYPKSVTPAKRARDTDPSFAADSNSSVFVLDDSDEDQGAFTNKARSPGATSSGPSKKRAPEVIDLTLDSDDETEYSPPSNAIEEPHHPVKVEKNIEETTPVSTALLPLPSASSLPPPLTPSSQATILIEPRSPRSNPNSFQELQDLRRNSSSAREFSYRTEAVEYSPYSWAAEGDFHNSELPPLRLESDNEVTRHWNDVNGNETGSSNGSSSYQAGHSNGRYRSLHDPLHEYGLSIEPDRSFINATTSSPTYNQSMEQREDRRRSVIGLENENSIDARDTMVASALLTLNHNLTSPNHYSSVNSATRRFSTSLAEEKRNGLGSSLSAFERRSPSSSDLRTSSHAPEELILPPLSDRSSTSTFIDYRPSLQPSSSLLPSSSQQSLPPIHQSLRDLPIYSSYQNNPLRYPISMNDNDQEYRSFESHSSRSRGGEFQNANDISIYADLSRRGSQQSLYERLKEPSYDHGTWRESGAGITNGYDRRGSIRDPSSELSEVSEGSGFEEDRRMVEN